MPGASQDRPFQSPISPVMERHVAVVLPMFTIENSALRGRFGWIGRLRINWRTMSFGRWLAMNSLRMDDHIRAVTNQRPEVARKRAPVKAAVHHSGDRPQKNAYQLRSLWAWEA